MIKAYGDTLIDKDNTSETDKEVKYSEHFTGRKESVPLNNCLLSTVLNNVR